MKVIFNGRTEMSQGKRPKKPVMWSGTFLVADECGNAQQADWKLGSGGLLTYEQAKAGALALIDQLAELVHGEHGRPIKKVTFALISR